MAKILLIHVDNPMNFGSAKNMVRRLESVKGYKTFTSVVLDLSKVSAIDGTAALAVEDMLNIVQTHHNIFSSGHAGSCDHGIGWLGSARADIRPGHGFASRLEALQKASLVEEAPSKDSSGPQAPNRNLRATPLTGVFL